MCISRAAPSHFAHRLTESLGRGGGGEGGGGLEDRGKLRRRIPSEKSDTQVTHMHFFFSFLFFFGSSIRMYPYVSRMYSYVLVCYSYVLVCNRMSLVCHPCGVLVTIFETLPQKHTIGHRRSISGNRPPSGNAHRKMPPNL